MSTERLVFSYRGDLGRSTVASPLAAPRREPLQDAAPEAETRERRDWAFTGLLAFTVVLYFRPQEQLPGFSGIPLAEIAALFALAAMVIGRITRGLSVTRVTPEVVAVAALGGVMLLTAPFSTWPGGAVGTFTDLFAKVILLFLLLTNTLTSPARIYRLTWVMVIATGYIATRAVFDYARGFNLIENGRVQGAVGGMFQNPNDLALNMVAVLPMAALVAMRSDTTRARLFAWFLTAMMIGAVMASHSRGGFVGLAVMVLIFAAQRVRRQPQLVLGGAMMLLLAIPFAPASYWTRMASITDESIDPTGSRESRRVLMREAWQTFLAFPMHGVGAGQFQNYNPPDRIETWRETHNVPLQVAAELGVLGLVVFGYLLWRAFGAGRTTTRWLRRARGAVSPRWPLASAVSVRERPAPPAIAPPTADYLQAHAWTMTAAVAGWFVCALFASVAYHWTFYYLLALAVAPHHILQERLTVRKTAKAFPARQSVEARV
ncbi:hypothetical protein BH24ACI5_BH24ACI5_08910 [soil metagenome]